MEKVIKKTQVKIVAENTLGLVSDVTGLIADKGINIEDCCAYSVDNKAIIYLLTNDDERTIEILKSKGYSIEVTEVIILRLWNHPGVLSAVTTKFKQNGVYLYYIYGTSSLGGERMTFVFSSDNNEKAEDIFDKMVNEEANHTI
jgi:hypothetical protein